MIDLKDLLPEKRLLEKNSVYLQYDKGFNHCRMEAEDKLKEAEQEGKICRVPSEEEVRKAIYKTSTCGDDNCPVCREQVKAILKLLKDKRKINENNTRVSKIQKCLSRRSK